MMLLYHYFKPLHSEIPDPDGPLSQWSLDGPLSQWSLDGPLLSVRIASWHM